MVKNSSHQPNFVLVERHQGNQLLTTVMLDIGLRDYSRKENLPWMVVIDIDVVGDDNSGFPDQNEARILNNFEDSITSKIRSVSDSVFLGRMTIPQSRRLYYYVFNPSSVNEVLQTVIDSREYAKEFEYKIEKDADWDEASRLFTMANSE